MKTSARFMNKKHDTLTVTYAVFWHTTSGIQRTYTLTTEEVNGRKKLNCEELAICSLQVILTA